MSNPLLPPKSAVAFFLGGAGGVFGIASSVSIILNPVRGDQIGFSGLDTGAEIFSLSVYFTLPAALVTIFGALLTLRWLKAGGAVLIIASFIGMLGSIVPVSLAYSNPFTCCPTPYVAHADSIFFLSEITIWPWVLMILTAGVLALARVHEFQKRITNSQARVNPVQVPHSLISCLVAKARSKRTYENSGLRPKTPSDIGNNSLYSFSLVRGTLHNCTA